MCKLKQSEILVAQIITRLMENGSAGLTISISDFDIGHEVGSSFFDNTIRWLKDEGVLRYREMLPDTENREIVHYSRARLEPVSF